MPKKNTKLYLILVTIIAIAGYAVSNMNDESSPASGADSKKECVKELKAKIAFTNDASEKMADAAKSKKPVLIKAKVTNLSSVEFSDDSGPEGLRIGYYVKIDDPKIKKTFNEGRFIFTEPLRPTETREIEFSVKTPTEKGKYILVVALVEEKCFWHTPEANPDDVAIAGFEVE